MSVVFVQEERSLRGGVTNPVTLDDPPAAGSLIAVMVFLQDGAIEVSGITDTAGNTYVRATRAFDGVYRGAEIWYCYPCQTSAPFTVTLTFTDNLFISDVGVYEFSGLNVTGNPVQDTDGVATDLTVAPYDFSFGTVTPSGAGDLLLMFARHRVTTQLDTFPPGTTDLNGGSYLTNLYGLATDLSPYVASASVNGSCEPLVGCIVCFKASDPGTYAAISQGVIEVLLVGEQGEPPPPDEPPVLVGTIYSSVDLPDPSSYYLGFKDGRVLSFGMSTRTLSDLTGQWSANDISVVLADTDRAVRDVLQRAKGLRETPVIVRMIADSDRRALNTPTVVFRGALRAWRPRGDLAVELEYTDAVGLKLARREKDRMLPTRTLTATDFPNIPAETLNRAVPIIYGSHERLTGACPVVYVGVFNHSGLNTHTWVVAGHACKGVTAIFLDGVEVSYSAWYAFGLSTWPTSVGYVDVNGRRYTIIQGVGADADAVAAGTKTLTVNVDGVEVMGDGTAMLMTQSFLQYLHFFRQFVLDTYQGGNWPETPIEWESGWCQINAQSFVDAQAETVRYIGDVGYLGQAYIGPDTRTVRDWLAVWNTSLNCRLGLNRYHQWTVSVLPAALDTEALAALPRISDQQDVLRGSLSIDALDDEAITRATVRAYRVPAESDVFGGAETYVDTVAETDAGNEILAVVDLDFLSTSAQTTPLPADLSASSEDVAKRWIGMRSAATLYRVTFDAGLCAYEAVDVGDLFRLTHFAGVSVDGWTDRILWCESIALDIDRRVATFTALDVTHVYEGARTLDELIGDEIITPPPPPPDPDPVAAWGFFDCNAAESGGDNVVDGDTVTLGTQTYTFKTALTGAANEVLVGAINDDSVWNLTCAINAGTGEGVLYGTGTTANASASAGYFGRPQPPPGGVVQGGLWVEALTPGVAGNSITWTETSTHARCFHEGNIEHGHLEGGSD